MKEKVTFKNNKGLRLVTNIIGLKKEMRLPTLKGWVSSNVFTM